MYDLVESGADAYILTPSLYTRVAFFNLISNTVAMFIAVMTGT